MGVLAPFLCSLVLWFQERPQTSPDGYFYTKEPNVRPYCMRRFYPWLLRKAPFSVWRVFAGVFLALAGAFVGLKYGVWHSILFMGLPLVRTCFKYPVLTDAPALFFLTLGLYLNNPWIMAIGGLFNEKVPLFGSLALWTPLPLIGLIAPIALHFWGVKPGQKHPVWLKEPFKEAWKLRKRFLDPNLMVLPWGFLVFGMGGLGIKGSLALLAGYAQLLVAQDGARLYQWAFFALLPHVQGEYLPVFALLQWCNPWKDTL